MTTSIDYQAIREAVTEVLHQGECLLKSLTDEHYNQNVRDAFNASIGGHYRHCLEHFEALLLAKDQNEVNYDARQRNPALETNRDYALQRTGSLSKELAELFDDKNLEKTVLVRCKVSYQGNVSPAVPATLAREAMYGVVHAIHHFALIAVMCQILDISLPVDFGVAPSTVHHQQKQTELQASINSVSAG